MIMTLTLAYIALLSGLGCKLPPRKSENQKNGMGKRVLDLMACCCGLMSPPAQRTLCIALSLGLEEAYRLLGLGGGIGISEAMAG